MKIGLIGLLFPVLLDKVVYGYTSRILPDADMAEFKRKHKIVLINDLTGPDWLLIRLANRSFRYWNTGDHAVYARQTMEAMLRNAGFCDIKSRNLTPFSYVCCGSKGRQCRMAETDR